MKEIITTDWIKDVSLEERLLTKHDQEKFIRIANKERYSFHKFKLRKNWIWLALPVFSFEDLHLYFNEKSTIDFKDKCSFKKKDFFLQENYLRHQLSIFNDKRIFKRVKYIYFRPVYMNKKGHEISGIYSACRKTLVLFLTGFQMQFSNYKRIKLKPQALNGMHKDRLQMIFENILSILIPKNCFDCRVDSCDGPMGNYCFEFQAMADSRKEHFLKTISAFFEDRDY